MVWAVSLSTMGLIPHSLTPRIELMAFGVWLSLVTSQPLAHPELYLHKLLPEAVPKYISGRTSYFRHFTPTHSSSQHFATYTGSDLHPRLVGFHPGHG
jgi:hypothetical protein